MYISYVVHFKFGTSVIISKMIRSKQITSVIIIIIIIIIIIQCNNK